MPAGFCSVRKLRHTTELGTLTFVQRLTIAHCHELEALPPVLCRILALRSLELRDLPDLLDIESVMGQVSLQILTINGCGLRTLPDVSKLTLLERLTIWDCEEVDTLPAGIWQAGTLKQLVIVDLPKVVQTPNLVNLTSLQDLKIDNCFMLEAPPEGMFQLGGLKRLSIRRLPSLAQVPDTLGEMTALERLTLCDCDQLETLPASFALLSRLERLEIDKCPVQHMPCIKALTAMRVLALDYTQGRSAFRVLPLSLPYLHQLDRLEITVDSIQDVQVEDVIAIGRALRAWPPPLLERMCDDICLSTCWRELGMPTEAADWTNSETLVFFRMQQHKLLSFTYGMHARLGASSVICRLNAQVLQQIADEVLGRE
eukprot:Tamp_19037.p1 GENE.Tamp_19037~~Tamp_19037.p1  ORF type:complete len:371 (+),score=61.98 Tamp_19037:2-1114(+)